MITVRQLMRLKYECENCETYSVSPNASVFEALQLMAEKNVGAVMVREENGEMVGIFTERDYARKFISKETISLDIPLKELMTRRMYTVTPYQSIEDCMSLMTGHRIRHLPVMEGGRMVGMVSMRDVVEVILASKDEIIDDLQKYILGQGYPR